MFLKNILANFLIFNFFIIKVKYIILKSLFMVIKIILYLLNFGNLVIKLKKIFYQFYFIIYNNYNNS